MWRIVRAGRSPSFHDMGGPRALDRGISTAVRRVTGRKGFRRERESQRKRWLEAEPGEPSEDTQKACMEHEHGGLDRLRCAKRGKHRHEVVLPGQGEGKSQIILQKIWAPDPQNVNQGRIGVRHNYRDSPNFKNGNWKKNPHSDPSVLKLKKGIEEEFLKN